MSVDLPMLSDSDGRDLLSQASSDLSLDEKNNIINVLGTNPRRLKRFGSILALWRLVAQTVGERDKQQFDFSPLRPA